MNIQLINGAHILKHLLIIIIAVRVHLCFKQGLFFEYDEQVMFFKGVVSINLNDK